MPELEGTIAKYQNPAEADKLMKVQQDLDETKIILVCRAFAASMLQA
jgi:synaptobrevin family protein YKT6